MAQVETWATTTASKNEKRAANLQLEDHLRSEPDLPFAATSRTSAGQVQRGGDNPEVRVSDIRVRIVKMGSVRHTKHLHPELKLYLLGDGEGAKHTGIQIEEARTPNDVAASSAKAYLSARHGTE